MRELLLAEISVYIDYISSSFKKRNPLWVKLHGVNGDNSELGCEIKYF